MPAEIPELLPGRARSTRRAKQQASRVSPKFQWSLCDGFSFAERCKEVDWMDEGKDPEVGDGLLHRLYGTVIEEEVLAKVVNLRTCNSVCMP